MLWLYIVLAIIALIAAVLAAAVVPRVTVELHLKNKVLDVVIRSVLFKKKIRYDFSQKQVKKEKKDRIKKRKDKEKSGFGQTLGEIKQRVFKTETGFDTEEAKNVKTELYTNYGEALESIKNVLAKLRYRIQFSALRIRLEYGTGDPADTGMIYGYIWNAVGIFHPILASYFDMKFPTLDITPDFYNKRFDIDVKSIIKVRPAHIIYAVFEPTFTYLKNKIFKGSGKNG